MPTRLRRKYKLIKKENESPAENANRLQLRDMLVKLMMTLDQEERQKEPDRTLIELMERLIERIREKALIEIIETRNDTRIRRRFGEEIRRTGPNEKLSQIHEEIRELRPALKADARKYETNQTFREGLNQALGINKR